MDWIQYSERVVGEGSPIYEDVANRPAKTIWTAFTTEHGTDGAHGSTVTNKLVTNGDSHDHAGGDGAQIDHGGLAGLSDDDHAQYIKHSLATDVSDFLVSSGEEDFDLVEFGGATYQVKTAPTKVNFTVTRQL